MAELAPDAIIEEIEVDDMAAAERLRMFGSPTVQIDGVDVEPGAAERSDFAIG